MCSLLFNNPHTHSVGKAIVWQILFLKMSVRFGVVESHLGGVQVVVGDDKVPCNTTVRRGRGRLTAWRRLASTTINCR